MNLFHNQKFYGNYFWRKFSFYFFLNEILFYSALFHFKCILIVYALYNKQLCHMQFHTWQKFLMYHFWSVWIDIFGTCKHCQLQHLIPDSFFFSFLFFYTFCNGKKTFFKRVVVQVRKMLFSIAFPNNFQDIGYVSQIMSNYKIA